MLAGFAAHGKTARAVGSRLQASLHRLADAQIFILHTASRRNAALVEFAIFLTHIAEGEFENDPAWFTSIGITRFVSKYPS